MNCGFICSTEHIYRNYAMFRYYLQGLLGFALSLIGGLAAMLLIFSMLAKRLGVFVGNEINEPFFLAVALVVLFIGGYLRYLSKQTIRSGKG